MECGGEGSALDSFWFLAWVTGHDDEILQPRSTEGAGGWGMGQGGMSWLGHVGGEVLTGHADLGV